MHKLLIIFIIFFMIGCDKSSDKMISGGNSAKTYKESELTPETKTVTHDDTVILHLEENIPHSGDTGTTGVDVVTYEYTHPVQQTVCLEKHDEINYRLEIKNEEGNLITEITNGNCQAFSASEGKYYFYLSSTSNGKSLGTGSTVFIRPYAETTHCDDYKSPDVAKTPETVELKTANHCTSDPNLTCTIPATYSDIPYGCPFSGPWYYSDFYTCAKMDPDESENCKEYLYQKCDSIETLCKNYWQDYSESYEDWGDSGYNIWTKCFGGDSTQYLYPKYSNIADPVIKSNFQKYTEQFCKDVAADCSSGWKISSSAPENCDGFVKYSKYSDLDLKSGEVAVHQRTYLHIGRNSFGPADDDIVMVLNGRCDNIPHRAGTYILGPQTQVVIYPFSKLKGKPFLFENTWETENQNFLLPVVYREQMPSQDPSFISMIPSTESSLTVTSASGTTDDLCRIKAAGIVCDKPTAWDVTPKLTGEVVFIKMADTAIKTGTNCSAAYLFDHRCDDLNKLGLRNYGPDTDVPQALSRVILPDSDTILRSFNKTAFSGSATVSQGSSPSPSTVYLDSETVSSAQAYKLPDYNHTILISLRKCCGCDLENVDFTGNDLSRTVLTGSNMNGAVFNNTNLIGADLRDTSLQNTKFTTVQLGDNYFGCADLSNADMVDPADSSKSTATVSGTFNWEISSTYNGITVSCDETGTNLYNSKIPIQILPKKSWKTLQLQNAVLLDKIDNYNLSGIDLSGGNYSGLRTGGEILNMQGANLSGSNLTNTDFSSIDFSPLIKDKTAQYSDFSNARIGGASFANANLEGATFSKVIIDGISGSVNFSYSMLINAVFEDCDLGKADFSDAYIYSKFRETVTTQKKALISNLTAKGSVFTNSFLSKMTFINTKITDGNFNSAQMVGVTFDSNSDLSNTKFSDAYLQGADFSQAVLTNASFSGAYLSLKDGYWHYSIDDPECTDIRIEYKKTNLGSSSDIICPNGEKGKCDTDEKLSRKDKKIVEPPCVDGDDEDIFGNNDCITHEYLEKNIIPECDENNKDVMQCGCLVEGE